jgi:nucleoside-diphosphate-sugar epimerase
MNAKPVDSQARWQNHATRILVLGASGRLGCALRVRVYRTKLGGRPIDMIWQFRSRETQPDGASSGQDLAWDLLGGECPPGLRADIVVGLAGIVPGRVQDMKRNVDIGLASLRVAQAVQARHVFLTSSAAVYGNGPFGEQDTPVPLNAYGAAKLAMEQAAQAWCADHAGQGSRLGPRLGLTVLRIGNVAGADALLGPGPRHVDLDVGLDHRSLSRSYIGPNRLSDMIVDLSQMAAAGRALPPILNVALAPSVSFRDLLDAAGWAYTETLRPDLSPIDVELETGLLHGLGLQPERGAGAADIWNDVCNLEP